MILPDRSRTSQNRRSQIKLSQV